MARIRILVIAVNGVVYGSVFRDLKGVAKHLGMNYDSLKAKKRVKGVQQFSGGLTITECYLIASKRKGNINKFHPEYKAMKKAGAKIPATEEEQRMEAWRLDGGCDDSNNI